jgi:hypothetical protein
MATQIRRTSERSGHEIFDRDLTYDTNSDPGVCAAAGERKKLAQCHYVLAKSPRLVGGQDIRFTN